MGGCISIQVSCDQVLNRAGSCLWRKGNHIGNLEKNLVALEKSMEVLKARRDDVLTRVQREEAKGQQRLNEVQMLKEVENLKSNGVFEAVALEKPDMRCVVEERPLQPVIFGQETMLEMAWNRLMDNETAIMGLYGMGGVGKTTHLTQINNKFRETVDGVQVVIWVVVSSDLRVEKIQDDIAKKLGLRGEEWNQKEKIEKVTDIHARMQNKRFVLLLDDIWRKVNLTEIGVPSPTRENGCKVVFTTRSREVCGRMGVDDPMKVQCLTNNEAWHDTCSRKRSDHSRIPEQVRKVAEKCRGLPLALNVIGETMSSKRTIQEWHHAVQILNSYAADFSDYLIEKEKLIDYWICEGFISENKDRERAVNQGYDIIGNLVRSCLLLEEGSNKSKVKMHDVVRDMALWISSDLGENRENCIVRAGVGLCEVPKVEKWSAVEKMSLMINNRVDISGSPKCPKLTTLFLHGNMPLASISGKFFMRMPKLVVLDISQNLCLNRLPEEMSWLVSVKYLDLSRTMISQLHVCLRKLKKLMHLYLEGMRNLRSIDGISSLSSLRTLVLLHCNKLRFDESWKELLLLKHSEVLTIEIKLFFSPMGRRCIRKVVIKDIREESFGFLNFPTILRSLKAQSFPNLSSVSIEGV
ncbi:hypothetical protein HID58_071316, partial [Brassica napus]